MTASDCRPSLVTRRPLIAPHTTPTISPLATARGRFPECCHTNPNVQLDRAAVDDTDRSISPAMIRNVMENAISMISPMLWIRNVMLLAVRNLSFQRASDEQREHGEHRDELVPLESARGPSSLVTQSFRAFSSKGHDAVCADGQEQERAIDGLLPELRNRQARSARSRSSAAALHRGAPRRRCRSHRRC